MINGRIPGSPLMGANSSISGAKVRAFKQNDDPDPMAGLTNMVDAMLVLAVGLMMALVVAMNVSLPDLQELLDEDLTQIDNPEEITDEVFATDNPYVELGRVYQDPLSGKTYVLKDDSESSESSDDADTNNSVDASGA